MFLPLRMVWTLDAEVTAWYPSWDGFDDDRTGESAGLELTKNTFLGECLYVQGNILCRIRSGRVRSSLLWSILYNHI